MIGEWGTRNGKMEYWLFSQLINPVMIQTGGLYPVYYGKRIVVILVWLVQHLMPVTMLVTGQNYFSSLQMISSLLLMTSGMKIMAMLTHLEIKVIPYLRILRIGNGVREI